MIRFPALPVLACLALAACSATPSKEQEPVVTLAPSDIASALLSDESLAQELEIQNQELIREPNNVLLAQSYLFNKSTNPLDIEARTLFKSVRGETVEITEWKRLILLPGKQTPFVSPTVNPIAGRYLLEIRRTK